MEKVTVYMILESWHNRCDNGTDDPVSVHPTPDAAKARLREIAAEMSVKGGLGADFAPDPGQGYTDSPARSVCRRGTYAAFWYSCNGVTGPCEDDGADIRRSEYRRVFRIQRARVPAWEFTAAEQFRGPAGNRFAGVLTDGTRHLYWHAFRNDGKDSIGTCHIYGSVRMSPESEECSYPWTAENDALVTQALLCAPDDRLRGENGVLRGLRFLPAGAACGDSPDA